MLQAKTLSGGAEAWGDRKKQELSWLPRHPTQSTLTSNLMALKFAFFFFFLLASIFKNSGGEGKEKKKIGVAAAANACLLVLRGHI